MLRNTSYIREFKCQNEYKTCSTESGEGHLQALNIAVQSAAVMDGFLGPPEASFRTAVMPHKAELSLWFTAL